MMMRITWALLLLGASAMAQAGVMYRWVDKDGVLNYSQVEPQGVKAEKIVTRGSIASPGEDPVSVPEEDTEKESAPRLTEEQQRKLDELKAVQAQEEQQIADIKRSNCEKATRVLERLKQSEHIRVQDEAGVQRIVGEEERQRRIEEAQAGMARNCE